MAAKSIVEVEVNSSQFDAFYALFQKYQKQLNEMPAGWEKVAGVIDDAGGEMDDFAKLSKSSKDFLMISAIHADSISKSMARAIGVQDKFNVKVKDGAIQMTRMQKASTEMHKSILGMSSVLLKLGTLGAGAAGAAVGAVYDATSKVADLNLQARGLGLPIGMPQAFGRNFEKFGLDTSDLGNVANAQGDVSKWRAFLAAGLTPQQIQNEDSEQLTVDFARAASGKFGEWQKAGMPAASLAQAYGFTDVLSLQQLRAGSGQTPDRWFAAQNKTLADAKNNAIDQGAADRASDVKAALGSDWDKVANEFNSQLATAGPELKTLGDAAAAAAVNLLKVAGPEAKKILDALEGPPVSRADAANTDKTGRIVGGWAQLGYGMRDLFSGNGGTQSAPTLDSILDAQLQIESAGGKHLLSPKGAKGPYQFMDATWKEWGHGDVNDPVASRDAARRYDTFLLKHYGGDVRKALAAYNWGMGNVDKDVATHGKDWEKYAPKEPQNYNAKLMQLLLQKGQNVNINITNNTSANVATSMNAAPH